MYRFFEEAISLSEDKIYFSKENSHHIHVLRIEDTEEFEVVIDGKVYLSKLIEANSKEAIGQVLGSKIDENESNIRINLYQGLPKSDKFEWIIQKATELGVSKIIPFSSSRTIVKWDEKKEKKKLKRYEDIALSAAKQSKRSVIPKIENLMTFKEMVNEIDDGLTILAYENRGKTLKDILKESNDDTINIIIGPEGGFSEEEVLAFENKGAKIVNLGNRILRTETAAISLIAMVQYELGDIN